MVVFFALQDLFIFKIFMLKNINNTEIGISTSTQLCKFKKSLT